MHIAVNTFEGLERREVELLRGILSEVEGEGVEIGCLDGYGAARILELSKLRLTSIDPIIPDSMEASLIGDVGRLKENVAAFGDRHTFIQDYSHNVIKTFTKKIDFLFIDGDHNYEAVMRDFNEWTPLLKVGGILAIHDSRMSRPGGANFHVGPSRVADERIYADTLGWRVIGEAFSLTVASKLQ